MSEINKGQHAMDLAVILMLNLIEIWAIGIYRNMGYRKYEKQCSYSKIASHNYEIINH